MTPPATNGSLPADLLARIDELRPRYPTEEANLSLQIGVNVVMYAMTH